MPNAAPGPPGNGGPENGPPNVPSKPPTTPSIPPRPLLPAGSPVPIVPGGAGTGGSGGTTPGYGNGGRPGTPPGNPVPMPLAPPACMNSGGGGSMGFGPIMPALSTPPSMCGEDIPGVPMKLGSIIELWCVLVVGPTMVGPPVGRAVRAVVVGRGRRGGGRRRAAMVKLICTGSGGTCLHGPA